MRHFLTIGETSSEALGGMLRRAIELRSSREPLLRGKTLCCLFEKPSLRTRVSFEQAMRYLGGDAMTMANAEVGIGSRESPADVARVLGQMVDVVMARVKAHDALETMAAQNVVPIINGLSERAHPAQALADVLTLIDEFSPSDVSGVRGRTIAFVGDWNNVARSLCVACARLGVVFRMCCPPGYDMDETWVTWLRALVAGCVVERVDEPRDAVSGADAVYCDTFISMGQESERDERLERFAAYQVNDDLMSVAPSHAIVLHCLPAYRGVEITDSVMDGPQSRVFQQARNRMDAQIGLLAELLS